jgi:hypothetical protein
MMFRYVNYIPTKKEKASKDREFIKIMNDASFIDLIK